MTKTEVTFNGVKLTDSFVVSDLVRPFLQRTVEMTSVDGRDGSIYRSARYDAIEVRMRLTFLSEDKGARVMAFANLVKALDVDEPTPLYISDDNGWYYLAVPKGGDISRWIGAESFPLTFVCPDPRRYGETHTWDRPVGGNAPTSLSMRIRFVAGESQYIMRTVTVSNSIATNVYKSALYLRFAAGSLITHKESGYLWIDSEHRQCAYSETADGEKTLVLPTPDSEWHEVLPSGRNLTRSIQGFGSSYTTTSEITDRWL